MYTYSVIAIITSPANLYDGDCKVITTYHNVLNPQYLEEVQTMQIIIFQSLCFIRSSRTKREQ